MVDSPDKRADGRRDERAVVGASVRGHWVQLGAVAVASGLYLWRTDVHPRWPVLAGVVVLCAQTLVRAPHARRAAAVKVAGTHVTGLEYVLLFMAISAMAGLPLLYVATPLFDSVDYALPGWAAIAGVALASAGLWVFHRSHADLGEQWSASLQIGNDHRLVSRGVYSRVRHPMYAALWLLSFAQPLFFQNWIAGPPAIVAFGLLYLVRVPREEAMMNEAFGAAYADYQSLTGRILPRI